MSENPLFKRFSLYENLPSDAPLLEALQKSHNNGHADVIEINELASELENGGGTSLDWRSSSSSSLSLWAAGLVPLIPSSYLLYTTLSGKRFSGSSVNNVIEHRIATQVIISIIAKVLATANVYLITSLMKFGFRIRLTKHGYSLDQLKCFGSMVTQQYNRHLPGHMIFLLTFVLFVFAIPNILWTGALTPAVTSKTGIADRLPVAGYSSSSDWLWSKNDLTQYFYSNCTGVSSSLGTFTPCPAATLLSGLIAKASQATANTVGSHLKHDNSRFSYIGRSYGVGASVGLTDEQFNKTYPNMLNYNYTEPGYRTQVQCAQNATTDRRLLLLRVGNALMGLPFMYYVFGRFPNTPANGSADFYFITGLWGSEKVIGLGARSVSGQDMISLSAGAFYHKLNTTECSITYTPDIFSVHVDTVNKTIKTMPLGQNAAFDPDGGLRFTATTQVNVLGMIATSSYVSIIGDALMANIDASSGQDQNIALANSFTAMIDEILGFVAGSQLILARDQTTVDVTLAVQALELGAWRYVYGCFIMCLILLLALLVEAARTKMWRSLPALDFLDFKSTIMASAVAGPELQASVWSHRLRSRSTWTGSRAEDCSKDEGAVKLRIGRKVVKQQGIRVDTVAFWPEGAPGFSPLR